MNAYKSKVIEAFRQLVDPQPVAVSHCGQSKVTQGNKYRQQGLEFKGKRARTLKTYTRKPSPEPHNESRIQRMIEEHPFLLYTPRLYPGGLFLDSVISKLRLFSGKIPDFAYFTVCGTSIKMTLVEIESSVHQLFCQNFSRGTLHSNALTGLNQVRGWKKDIQDLPDPRGSALLSQVAPLFEDYPLPLWDEDGVLHEWVNVEVDYLLIVGRDRPKDACQQEIVDDIYRNEGIVLMSYPMMIEALSLEDGLKNMLKRAGDQFRVLDVHEPGQLLCKAPIHVPSHVDTYPIEDADPHDFRFAGLGVPHRLMTKQNHVRHPHAMREMLLRSKGYCEYPNCTVSVYMPGDCRTYMGLLGRASDHHWMNYGIFCHQHDSSIMEIATNRRKIDLIFTPILKRREGFRPDVDSTASTIVRASIERYKTKILNTLGGDFTEKEDVEALVNISIKMRSGPYFMGLFFYDHAMLNYFGLQSRRFYSDEHHRLCSEAMLKMGVMKNTESNLQDTVFTDRIVKWLLSVGPAHASDILMSICFDSLSDLERNILAATR